LTAIVLLDLAHDAKRHNSANRAALQAFLVGG
jgi:hypothetical protein